ncbi:MAG: glycosyltransferase family 9 protein, partial [Pseudomonadota bacterium]|nr:glycosyltransferase family 9 protein [Pseudomonadota bacterium]
MIAPEPKRVLIIRLSAIGDVVFASPLVAACKKRYPEVEIDWLAEGVVRPLLTEMPGLNNVVLWPRQEWQDLWREKRFFALISAVAAFRRKLRARNFDLVIDAQGLVKSAFLAWLTGSRQRIGFKSKEPNGVFLTDRYEKSITSRISSEYLALADILGWDTSSFDVVLGLSASDDARARDLAPEAPFVVVTPFTTRPQKHWTHAHWRALIGRLAAAGHLVACLGGPGDREEAVVLLDGLPVLNWVGNHPLGVSAGLVRQAVAVIGVDTGLTHMGIAADIPTVALFGSTCPYLETGRHNVRVIYHGLECAPCKRSP